MLNQSDKLFIPLSDIQFVIVNDEQGRGWRQQYLSFNSKYNHRIVLLALVKWTISQIYTIMFSQMGNITLIRYVIDI